MVDWVYIIGEKYRTRNFRTNSFFYFVYLEWTILNYKRLKKKFYDDYFWKNTRLFWRREIIKKYANISLQSKLNK